jgi:hypothetical protein
MALREYKVNDILRGGRGEVILRFDMDDLIELPCHCKYDPALASKDGNKAMLVKKIEIKNPDGTWSPYPSATWLDGVNDGEQLESLALIRIKGEDAATVMSSGQGVPDGPLLSAAKKAGIYTETLS